MNKQELLTASLEQKIDRTKVLIMDWYEQFDGKVYVAFSGGKDSTVLLHIVRSLYPDVPAVFANTGLEYPEIVEFVKTVPNTIITRPKMSFKEVLDRYGFPLITKEQSRYIEEIRTTKSDYFRDVRLNGKEMRNGRSKSFKLSEKWKYMLKAPFKISDKCCDKIKKYPLHQYEKETGRKAIIGTMAGESSRRKQLYLRDECNQYHAKHPTSKPLSFWNETDVWKYIRDFNIPYSKIYEMGYPRTGCMFCMYGVQYEKLGETRFDKMKVTHPKLYEYCMEKLNLKLAIEWVNKSKKKA